MQQNRRLIDEPYPRCFYVHSCYMYEYTIPVNYIYLPYLFLLVLSDSHCMSNIVTISRYNMYNCTPQSRQSHSSHPRQKRAFIGGRVAANAFSLTFKCPSLESTLTDFLQVPLICATLMLILCLRRSHSGICVHANIANKLFGEPSKTISGESITNIVKMDRMDGMDGIICLSLLWLLEHLQRQQIYFIR